MSGAGGFSIRADKLNVPEEKGIHPYVEVASDNAVEHMLLTVCTAQAESKSHGNFTVKRSDSEWTVEGSHNGRSHKVTLRVREDIPNIVVG